MISYFFIDRPIFASVLSIVITLTGAIAVFYLPIAQYPQITPPAVTVSINYPGASAQIVADTVAAPIEQQVNGVEGMLYMSSQMGNDGSYTLTVTFDIGADLNTALVMVQNRVALAMPQLPNSVQNQGITIRKRTPDILMVANLFSPNHRYDDIYLSNFAMINLRDELLRLDGVSDVNIFGERDYSIRIWLDPQKMAACNMTASDVAVAIRSQNKEAVAGQIGQPPAPWSQSFQVPIATLGRLADPEQFGDIIVKVGPISPIQQFLGTAGAFQGSSVPIPQIASPIQSGGTTGGGLTGSGLSGGCRRLPGGLPGGLTGGGQVGGGLISGGSSNTGTANSGLMGSNLSGPGMLNIGTTSSGTTNGTTSGTTGGAATGGGATSGGGGTTGGGATTGGGGTSGGGATSSGTQAARTGTLGSATGGMIGAPMTSASISNPMGSGATGGQATEIVPQRPSVGIVRLRDVARVEMGAQNYNQSCTFDGYPSVGLAIRQLPGTNALDVGETVKAKMKELKSPLPG